MKKHIGILILAVILLGNLIAGVWTYARDNGNVSQAEIMANVDNLLRVYRLIRTSYVDANHISSDQLMRGAMMGMARVLDPYSEYMPKQEAKEMAEETNGEFGGIGITVPGHATEFILIETVIPNTPAYRAGLQPGDMIVEVDGISTRNQSVDASIYQLRGEPGTKVKIKVLRANAENLADAEEIELTRAMIPLESVVNVATLCDGTVGYLYVSQFALHTVDEFENALRELVENRGVKSLIVDLRCNPGGFVDDAVKMASCFLPVGTLVATTEGVAQESIVPLLSIAPGYKVPDGVKVAVLLDRFTASAAEIFSGCLKDHGRAVLLGETSFGKGLIQTMYDFSDGSALKLTIARYFTPNHVCINGIGITPDIPVNFSQREALALLDLPLNERMAADKVIRAAIVALETEIIKETVNE